MAGANAKLLQASSAATPAMSKLIPDESATYGAFAVYHTSWQKSRLPELTQRGATLVRDLTEAFDAQAVAVSLLCECDEVAAEPVPRCHDDARLGAPCSRSATLRRLA